MNTTETIETLDILWKWVQPQMKDALRSMYRELCEQVIRLSEENDGLHAEVRQVEDDR